MFDNLTDKLGKALKNIRGYGMITENNISDIMREVRLALLEADVNYQVVKEFTNKVKEKALGEEVRRSLSPDEMFVKILKDELLKLLGEENSSLNINKDLNIIMLVGLHGSGKTTTIGKLGNYLRKKHNKKSLFIGCDVYRPAAIEQLKQLGKELDIKVYEGGQGNPIDIVKNGIKFAKDNNFDCILVDTAGRLHIDDELMSELNDIKGSIDPNEILLVIDSMIGQDAINVIDGFNKMLDITGVILTKLDSDTRGGVALSVRHLTKIPIKFIGTSEKLDGLTYFDSKRMVSRILGEGDLLSLAEKAEEVIDKEDAIKFSKKINKGDFNLEDFLKQLKQIKRLGSLETILKMIPGVSKLGLNNINIDPKQMARIEAIILSMTLEERRNPIIIKSSQKIRIANGSGTSVQEVNKLIKQFEQMKKMLKLMKKGKLNFPI